MRHQLIKMAIASAERGLPDKVIRAGVRSTVRQRLAEADAMQTTERGAMLRRWHTGPIALVPERANEQHYEVPAEFFEVVLGARLKYSSCLWDDATADLDDAEEAMLALSAERAGIQDGMRVLDLGCGWGSMSIYLAEHFPNAEIVAVSNSALQGEFIRKRAANRGLSNVTHRRADMNRLDVAGGFDAVVSIEVLEHVRNHPALFDRLAELTTAEAGLFIHVFAHIEHWWEFEDRGPGDWMARNFFSGGVMPSHRRFDRLIASHEVEESWWIDGSHYANTLDAWLAKLDLNRSEVYAALEPVYGDSTELWIQRWRMFLMACSEFFGFRSGELGVSHHRVRLAR
jgi:cyclopropane-fatty-acyl-phospholipid synthase